MSNIKKLSTFRQLSLNCETPEQKRKSLKKQYSEDIPDLIENHSKLNKKCVDQPPAIKIAWMENSLNLKKDEGVIVKKCKEIKRPTIPKLTRHGSLEKDSILYSKQELAERLRQAFREREKEKPNLNIFLDHSTKVSNEDYMTHASGENSPDSTPKTPKIIQPLFTNDQKSSFQIRKNIKSKNERSNNAIVIIPIIETAPENSFMKKNIDNIEETEPELEENLLDKINPKPINNVILRPLTAASKREKFQKRTNSAFNSTNYKSPLVRSSSAPSKTDQTKSKFLASKRKMKPSKRKELKLSEENDNNNNNKENPVNGVDIVTMVSLVSPSGSDEEIVETDNEKSKIKSSPRKKEINIQKGMSLRKAVKSVTFQQSSIHAIRSFSASFPARRGSMAATLVFENNTKSSTTTAQKLQEKRSTNPSSPNDDERVAKRRLLRNNNGETQSFDESESYEQINNQQNLNYESIDRVSIKIKSNQEQVLTSQGEEISGISYLQNDEEIDEEDTQPKFDSPKEKQCWEMYCKMTGKGINVSYDTILRGLLTPTEYRLRRKESVSELIL